MGRNYSHNKIWAKLKIMREMMKWLRSWEYIEWRLLTAYPAGWKYAIRHPIIFIKDMNHYIEWCINFDEYNKNR